MNLDDLKAVLDDDQFAAVTAPFGNILCVANAGSGKTRVLTHRVAYVLDQGEPESSVIMLTFTKKAANEMKSRIQGLLGRKTLDIRAGTFHSVFLQYIRENYELLGFKTDRLTILDAHDAEGMMAMVRRHYVSSVLGLHDNEFPFKAKTLCRCLSDYLNMRVKLEVAVNRCVTPNIRCKWSLDELVEHVGKILAEYVQEKRLYNMLDFDDILILFNKLLDDADFAAKIHSESPNIFVDEYQDVNALQFDIIQKLAVGTNRLMVVGDDAQSIYAFRGSDVSFIRTFENSFPNVHKYMIRNNYRSTEQVVDLGLYVINSSSDYEDDPKQMVAVRGLGSDIVYHTLPDPVVQAEYIVGAIKDLHSTGVSYDDIAILFRLNREPQELKSALQAEKIPYAMHCGISFYSKEHVRYVLDYLRFLYNPRSKVSFFNLFETVPGLGPRTVNRLFALFTKSGFDFKALSSMSVPGKGVPGFNALCAVILDGHDMFVRGEPISLLISTVWSQYFCQFRYRGQDYLTKDIRRLQGLSKLYGSLGKYLDEIVMLVSESDDDRGQVTVTTVHKSKGCEWKYVFLASATDGIMPIDNSEEERRLMYVAVTRARDVLDVSCVEYHARQKISCGAPSRFLRGVWKESGVAAGAWRPGEFE